METKNYNPKSPDEVYLEAQRGYFSQDYIETPKSPDLNIIPVAGGSVVQAGNLQSPNFRTQQKGWNIDSEGNAEFQEINANISNIRRKFKAASTITQGQAVYAVASNIIFDAYSESDVNSLSMLFSHTVGTAGSLRCLVATVFIQNDGDAITSMTYAGVNMTQYAKLAVGADYIYIYYLTNPATGANNVSAGRSGSAANGFSVHVASYYNIDQTTPFYSATSVSGISQTVSVPSNLYWTISAGRSTAGVLSSGTNNTVRGVANSFRYGDSNTPVSNGNITVSFTGGGGTQGMITVLLVSASNTVASVAPTSASLNTTSQSFIGFATESSVVNGDVSVIVAGIVTDFTNLSSGALYYLSDTTGQISTTSGTVTRKIGIAVSTSELLITNIW